MGGLDLDRVIVEMCEIKLQNELTLKNGGKIEEGDIVRPAFEKMIRRKLRRACEQAKIELSTELSAVIKVE